MTKKVIDYSKTIIYKIVCNDLNITDVYVGSTTDFIRRKSAHKFNCNKESGKTYNFKVYQYIRENGGWDNFTMVIVENYPCKDGNEARARERFWYETLNAKLNMLCPIKLASEYAEYSKQYYKTNKDQIVENSKQYYETNKDQIAEKSKLYREMHKDEIAEKSKQYREMHKDEIAENSKQYYEANKDKRAEYHKQYRETHKVQIAEKSKQYRETHKHQIAEYKKQYRETHKEQLAERQRKKIYEKYNPVV